MRGKQQHNIESAFVLVLFAVFAMTVVAVLALGANSYQRLVERDNEGYNKRIVTSYVTAKIRDNDTYDGVAVAALPAQRRMTVLIPCISIRRSKGRNLTPAFIIIMDTSMNYLHWKILNLNPRRETL